MTISATMGMTLRERLRHYSIASDLGCCVWTGSKGKDGYGRLWWNGRPRRAHRLAWEDAFFAVPPGHFVCHRCDNPLCINPDHLFLGTPKDNTRDMMVKGRNKPGRGHPRAAA